MTSIATIIDVSERIDVPGNATIQLSAMGNVAGIRLSDGRLVRPWVTWEIEEADGTHRELAHDELVGLGFEPTLEGSIGIELV